jgi:hypothetical protein
VISISRKGYGTALSGDIEAARSRFVIMKPSRFEVVGIVSVRTESPINSHTNEKGIISSANYPQPGCS